ncbi:MAG: winged helix-turn-helix domain-containing protein [Bryobacteraceae bacterium]
MGQPIQILAMLLERPGELVTREEIRKALWPEDTFVNFEHSLNAAMKRLRRALGDSPDNPRFIETLPRRGYRFIAPMERNAATPESQADRGVDSLAVLPFENTAADPETEFLSDGITESIINSLSQLSGVRVMARSTVFRYKGRDVDPRSVGRKLNVQAVLLGRVLLRGESLHIGTELVEVGSGWQLWGEQYNRKLSEILSVEEEISREISGKLRLRLTGEDRTRLEKRPTRNADAYWDYLKGRYYQNKMSEDALRESVAYFERALDKDPGYALAYAGMADSFGLITFFGMMPPLEALPRAREAAIQAVALDDTLAEAHCSLANIRKSQDWDWAGAASGYERALALNPNDANAHRLYASLLSAVGRSDEALSHVLRARELDPLSVVICMEVAWHCYIARDYERAIEHATSTLELEPEFPSALHVLGLSYEQLGRFEESVAAFEKAHATSRGNAATLAGMAHALGIAGRTTEAEDALLQLKEMGTRAYVPPYYRALVNVGLGKTDEALADLDDSLRERDLWLAWLKRDPRLDSLRAHARCQELLRHLGLAD